MTFVRYKGGLDEVDVFEPASGNTTRVRRGEVTEVLDAAGLSPVEWDTLTDTAGRKAVEAQTKKSTANKEDEDA